MKNQGSALWKCPGCGRGFAKKNQWHSCQKRSIDHHFLGKKPQLKNAYDVLITKLQEFGPIRIDSVKTSINLISKHNFGGINVQRGSLRLGFVSDGAISDARIIHSQRLGKNRIGYSVRVNSPDEIDDQLLGWMRNAYQLQS
jgi:uncharacterized C2H2 Zn-finger protein